MALKLTDVKVGCSSVGVNCGGRFVLGGLCKRYFTLCLGPSKHKPKKGQKRIMGGVHLNHWRKEKKVLSGGGNL